MPPVERFTLPSGARAVFTRAPASASGALPEGDLARLPVSLTTAAGAALPVAGLPLSDAHTLQVIARRRGHLADPPCVLRCSNCQVEREVRPAATFELGPYLDAELDDPELDESFDFARTHRSSATPSLAVRLAPREWADLADLRRASSAPGGLRMTSRVVRALGVLQLDSETDPRRIARRLDRDDGAFAALTEVFERAHYPRRLAARHACAACGAVETLALPLNRELSVHGAPDSAGDEGFVTPAQFEAWTRTAAAAQAACFEHIAVIVEHGTPDVDDDGAPLLGSYTPGEAQAGEVRLYFRSFAAEWREGGPYDVRAEIEETVRHELEHHAGHLRGTDPLDDEEHADIDDAVVRRVGRSEARRRATRTAGRDLLGFLRATWWLWLLATILIWLASRGDGAP